MPPPIARTPLAALALAAALLAPPQAAGQQAGSTSLELSVVEETSGRPVEDVRVQVEGARAAGWTNRNGRARVANVPHGERLVTISRPGYAAERVRVGFGGEPVVAEVELRRLPVTLAPVEVVAQMQNRYLRERQVYQRSRQGIGVLMGRDAIERLRPMQTIDLFRHVRGFRVNVTPRGEYTIESARGAGSFGMKCSPVVYVDGMVIAMPSGTNDPSDVVHPAQIEAVEAYAGPASIPPELNSTGSACGVIAIWTRFGV